MSDIFAARQHPEIPEGQMCDECGSLQYHATYCKFAPPLVRAGVRAAFDLLDVELRRVGALGDADVQRARENLGKAVGAASGFYEQPLPGLLGVVRAAQAFLNDHDAANKDADLANSNMIPMAWGVELDKRRAELRVALSVAGASPVPKTESK